MSEYLTVDRQIVMTNCSDFQTQTCQGKQNAAYLGITAICCVFASRYDLIVLGRGCGCDCLWEGGTSNCHNKSGLFVDGRYADGC